MAAKRWLEHLSQHERLNFLLTNRLPRRWLTLWMGRFSRIENPLIHRASFAVWRLFGGDFRLHEAKQTRFRSLHECFTRELKDGARSVAADPGVVVSPCDAVVGAFGRVEGTQLFQIKGFPYSSEDLLQDAALVEKFRDGWFVTLRLTSNMYHRFHAPCDCRVREVLYISGDTWNVNPIALKRIERLFCKNERAVLDLDVGSPTRGLALVPVAAILVASIRLKVPAGAAHADVSRPQPDPVRRDVPQRRRDELLRARLDDRRVRDAGICARRDSRDRHDRQDGRAFVTGSVISICTRERNCNRSITKIADDCRLASITASPWRIDGAQPGRRS